MKPKLCEVVQFIFKLCCFIIVVCMVSVWFKKYLKDEDLCLVDYINFENSAEIAHPELSFCFMNPFINHKLEEFDVHFYEYQNHLKADPFVENLTKIDFTNVTFNLEEYYISTGVSYENGEQNNSIDAEIHQTFTGFFYDQFLKCFSVDTKTVNMPGVKYITHAFKLEFFDHLKQTMMLFHGRDQFLLSESGKFVVTDENTTNGISIILLISKVEILNRRNKRSSPCLTDWKNWDDLALSKHTSDIGCSAPYHGAYQSFPVCSTENELKRWHKMVPTVKSKRDEQPCQVMPRISYDVIKMQNMDKELSITIGYPNEAKKITQSRAVDENALIGNIGGYIGLFLGMFIPFLLLFVLKPTYD